MEILIFTIIAGVLALLFSAFRVFAVVREGEGNETMQNIARAIQLGAAAFLKREYAVLAVFVAVVFVVLLVFIDLDVLDKDPLSSQFWDFDKDVPAMSLSYLIGAILSASAGYLGMTIAVRANVRTAAKAQEGLNPALRVAFNSGTVMGMTVVGLGILGLAILYLIWESAVPLAGFAFGASSIALFARVGGGIYTKAADVGADLVGKVEAGIPEDDPRNPATIADNVGDNVGDVAGMGADLFESYVGSIVATMALAAVAIVGVEYTGAIGLFGAGDYSFKGDAVMLPLLVAGMGIFAAILSTFLVRTGEQASQGRLLWALRAGVYGASGLVLVGAAIAIAVIDLPWELFWAILVGLIAGQIIGTVTEGFTSSEGFALGPFRYSPTVNLSQQAETGSGPVIIGGMSLGMLSTAIPLITIVVAIILANEFAGFYGIALAAVGMLAPLGVTLATDAYGPVADNAGGIAEQAGLDPEVRERTDALDQLGNTTAATGKGFAIGSAALTALALLATYSITTGRRDVQPPRLGGDGRHPHRRADAVRVLRALDGRGGASGAGDGGRGAPPVPREAGDHGRHRGARLRARGQHLHHRSAARDDHPGPAGRGRAHLRGRGDQRAVAGRSAHRLDRGRRHARHHDGERRRGLGQRQEVHRRGELRRQGLGSAQGRRGGRYRGRSVQGHLGPVAQHPPQADVDRGGGVRAAVHLA